MKGTQRDNSDSIRDVSASAPLPQLGYTIESTGHKQKRQTQTLSRVALGFAITAAVLSIVLITGIFWEVAYGKNRHRDIDALFGLFLLLCPLCMLLGLLLGAATRRTRTGKAAVFVSLAPLGFALFALIATLIVAFFLGIAKGVKR